jgi:hypothetical protein
MTDPGRLRRILLVLAGAIAAALLVVACGGASGDGTSSSLPAAADDSGATAKVTFLELGADKRLPYWEMRRVRDGARATVGRV